MRELFAEPIGFVWGAAINVVSTTLAFVVAPYAHLAHLMIIYLFGAVLISTRFGLAVSFFTIVTGLLAFDYFCIPPIFAFALPDVHSVVTFVGMLITALTFCYLNQRLRRQRTLARASEARTVALCELSLHLSEVANVADLPQAAELHLTQLFGEGTKVSLGAADPVSDRARVTIDAGRRQSDEEQRMLLAACADRIAVALERLTLGDAARRAQVEAEAERSRSALLSAVSHDLKTPLSSILAAGTTLLGQTRDDTSAKHELLRTIVEETERMNSLITNLLSVTRLESGQVHLNKSPEALDDLILGVLSRLSGRLEGRAVAVDAPHDLPFVPMDAVLVDQVLVNLLENVLRYTPPGSAVDIEVRAEDAELVLKIGDRGPGISVDEREKVFDKFYRGRQATQSDGGTGLGLTICRAVARAHGGRIQIDARPGGGTSVVFVLPIPPASSATAAGSQVFGARWEPA